MKSRFEPDLPTGFLPASEPFLVEPDDGDAREQQFSANTISRESETPCFVVDQADSQHAKQAIETEPLTVETGTGATTADLRLEPDPGAWRRELAAKVNKYRARRRSPGPRYPSLKLQFEPDWSQPRPEGALAPKASPDEAEVERRTDAAEQQAYMATETAKIIAFPRSPNPPPAPLDALADPVFDRPRILEAPEELPPPPAMGGILIEPAEKPAQERRPGFEIPLQTARMSRRLLASAIDAFIVASAFALFAFIFFRVTSIVPPLPQLLAASAGFLGMFWAAYQYLLLVRAGTTPGLRLTKLELDCFDGTPAKQSLRRWRVLASLLSGASLGLGYAWCFLDEDQLCWHDRITRTYMAPRTGK